MNNNSYAVWLPEPSVSDNTFARRGEDPLDWLARSTTKRARECRRFLNEHLSKLPTVAQADMLHHLEHRWKSAFFELIVARLLQELGANVVFEAANPEGKQPDFTAAFPDATIVVEATTPDINKPTQKELKERIPLLNFIEKNAPKGWWVGVWELPRIGHQDSKKAFKKKAREMLRVPPPNDDSEHRELCAELPSGFIRLRLVPKRSASKRLGWEAPISFFDDSVSRICHAVESKRSQVRSSSAPVILAVQASGMASTYNDFDRALFGHTYERYDIQGRLVERGFRPDGLFNRKGKGAPTYAGVLAFLEVGFHVCTAPVLYLHPRFTRKLPEAILQLEQRSYSNVSNQIEIEKSKTQGLIERLNLVEY